MNCFHKIVGLIAASTALASARGQEGVHYSGSTLSNVDYHDGRLSPAMGVHNIQVFRANREHPEKAEGMGWTYNHAPMLAYWNNRFYLEYLSDKIGESVPPGQTLLLTSPDGDHWSKPVVIFPPYKIPDGFVKEGQPETAHNLYAVMHQRMGFYTAKSKRLLVLGFYGICMNDKDDPNDGNGIGRVVREVLPDGKFGPIYFLHYNHRWNQQNTDYPFYTKSADRGFVDACNELMAQPLTMMQWEEEADRNDTLIPLQKNYKAFNFYHLPDGRVVGLWKNALTSISSNGGRSWGPVARAPHFVNANAKIWGQRTADGRYATVYNPSEYRWPLAISTSADGLDYTNLLLVNGEITTMRYGGNYKSYGPQYVRGIIEGDGIPPGNRFWVSYSMNKEDIWVASIPVPVTDKTTAPVNEVFDNLPEGQELDQWNIYSPLWAPVSMGKTPNGKKALLLKDEDPFDYAKAGRLFPPSKKTTAEFTVIPMQNNTGSLEIEFVDAKGQPSIRFTFGPDSTLQSKAAARAKNLLKYKAGEAYAIRVSFNTGTRSYTMNINGKEINTQLFFAPADKLERIVFRTGSARHFPDADTPADQNFDLPHAGESAPAAAFMITGLTTKNEDK
ncbi:MAG TPA: six-hairpin glycosidase [Chitinophagaceae bacterium]|jgi:hypothetical protein